MRRGLYVIPHMLFDRPTRDSLLYSRPLRQLFFKRFSRMGSSFLFFFFFSPPNIRFDDFRFVFGFFDVPLVSPFLYFRVISGYLSTYLFTVPSLVFLPLVQARSPVFHRVLFGVLLAATVIVSTLRLDTGDGVHDA